MIPDPGVRTVDGGPRLRLIRSDDELLERKIDSGVAELVFEPQA